MHSDDLERCFSTYREAFDKREFFRMEYRLRRFDGEYRWILDTGAPRFHGDGSFAGYIGSAVDVTNRKSVEKELALVNDRLRLAMVSGKSVGWEWDVRTGDDSWFGDLNTMFGIPANSFDSRVGISLVICTRRIASASPRRSGMPCKTISSTQQNFESSGRMARFGGLPRKAGFSTRLTAPPSVCPVWPWTLQTETWRRKLCALPNIVSANSLQPFRSIAG